MAMLFLASCDAGNSNSHSCTVCDTIATKYATNLTMVDHGDYMQVDFRNPWDTTRLMQTLLLVPRDTQLPDDMPRGTVVRTPLTSSIVYTSVHGSLIKELGALSAITGVCDAKYISDSTIMARVNNGSIADCGNSMSPNIERIIQLNPDAILLSAYENSSDHNKVAQIGIPIIDCIDYMESSPLARAEWIRFFGRLYGRDAEADSLFARVERSYLEIKDMIKDVDYRPLVMTELIYGQSWDVPGALSTVGVLINDAGGRNPFDDYLKSGSVRLAPEEVLYRAKDADIWLMKYTLTDAPTLRSLGKDHDIYTKFKPWQTGRVYGCDTNRSAYFDDASFHPERVLRDYARILHPELIKADSDHQYYNQLEP